MGSGAESLSASDCGGGGRILRATLLLAACEFACCVLLATNTISARMHLAATLVDDSLSTLWLFILVCGARVRATLMSSCMLMCVVVVVDDDDVCLRGLLAEASKVHLAACGCWCHSQACSDGHSLGARSCVCNHRLVERKLAATCARAHSPVSVCVCARAVCAACMRVWRHRALHTHSEAVCVCAIVIDAAANTRRVHLSPPSSSSTAAK